MASNCMLKLLDQYCWRYGFSRTGCVYNHIIHWCTALYWNISQLSTLESSVRWIIAWTNCFWTLLCCTLLDACGNKMAINVLWTYWKCWLESICQRSQRLGTCWPSGCTWRVQIMMDIGKREILVPFCLALPRYIISLSFPAQTSTYSTFTKIPVICFWVRW